MTPSRMVPVSAGVTSEPSFMTKKTFMPPSSSTALSLNWSRKSTCLQPWASASCWAIERSGVVAAALGGAGSAAAGAGVFARDPDGDGLEFAAEVVAGRGGDHAEGDLARRPDAQEGLGGDHERAQVQGFAVAGGDPFLVRRRPARGWRPRKYSSGSSGQGQAAGGLVQPGGVGLGAEGPDRAVGVAVGLQALEDLLAVVQHGGGRVQGDRAVGLNAGVRASRLCRRRRRCSRRRRCGR